MPTVRRVASTSTALLGIALAAGLLSAPAADAGPAVVHKTVQMTNSMTFSPAVLKVSRGTVVTWHNGSFVTHTTTSRTGLWRATVAPGHNYSRTFGKAGTFRYRCTIHNGMNGTIIVK